MVPIINPLLLTTAGITLETIPYVKMALNMKKEGAAIISITGLSLNFVGTLLVAFSIRKGEVIAMQEKNKHPKWESMIRYNPRIFYPGIASLALGFTLQILGQIPRLN